MKSVYVEHCDYADHCLKLVWNQKVERVDVAQAFGDLRVALDEAPDTREVIVILNGRVQFPVSVTTLNALPIHKHPNLRTWLVVSDHNPLAKVIGNVLSSIGQDQKIMWFKNEEEVRNYLMRQMEAR